MRVLTYPELEAVAPSPKVLEVLSDWIAAGKGVAAYQLTARGHPQRGSYKFYSCSTRPSAPLGIEHTLVAVYPPGAP